MHKDIQSVMQEDRIFPPSAEFRNQAVLKAPALERMYARAAEDYVGFWADLAVAEIDWHRPFTVPLDDSEAPNFRWFCDGQLNVSHNCLDVHLEARGDKVAILFEGEPGDVRRLTYAELHVEVCRFANALKASGIACGDRVVIYMPLIPEAVIAMQACARIGAVLNVAGHRLGTMEIESALVAHARVAEAAVVGKPHDIKGESVFAYVVLNIPKPEGAAAQSLIDELRGWVGDQLSPIAKPDEILLTDNLPKTRSGKIMRRLLRSLARGEEITQDMSTLENPGILEQLRGAAPVTRNWCGLPIFDSGAPKPDQH